MSVIAIIEDNCSQAAHLKETLSIAIPDTQFIIFGETRSAFEYSLQSHVDLFLVDIGLPDENGLDFVKKLRSTDKYRAAWVIFITAYPEFVSEAINEAHCYAYLTKPYNDNQLIDIVKPLLNNSLALIKRQYLQIKQRGVSIYISIYDILFIEKNQKELTIHTHNRKLSAGRTPLYKVLANLPPEIFIRCHRCFIINTTYIKRYEVSDKCTTVYIGSANNTDPVKISVGSTYRSNIDNHIIKKII